MIRHPAPAGEESLRDLFARVIDNGKAYAKAEVNLVKVTVSTKTKLAVPAIGFFIAALLLVQAALTVLTAALGALIALWLGWPAGLAIAALLVFGTAGLLAWLGIKRLTRAFQ
ncbi:phage holin family protein [uncultured Sphingomonas sp.]|uniref:phage holin family protein n=1 Tax=uncultured Sphingomonas sp. TaxID=158754 RepID=UPI0025D1A2BF|nr:phage holin family protein [uncultured Sphingomonas sp.]